MPHDKHYPMREFLRNFHLISHSPTPCTAIRSYFSNLSMTQDLGSNHVISWNHQEFEVRYECLSEEIKIGDYYLRLLLEEEEGKTMIHNS